MPVDLKEKKEKMNLAVLIVEDDPFIAIDLQDAFEDAGYDVLGPVATVKSGLSELTKCAPDVAILDYNLGTETSAGIAAKLDQMGVPYIFASGQMEAVISDETVKPVGVISKPFMTDTVIGKVEEILL